MNLSLAAKKPLLEAQDLRHSFQEGERWTEVLKGVSMKLYAGQTTAVVGPSGCGKSTLLYLLGLLDKPRCGKIFLESQNITEASDEDRTKLRIKEIGFVFQFHFLIRELSVLENVALPMRKSGKSLEESEEKATSILKRLGLLNKAKRFANKLSGGEQQRVAIARAIVNSPSLILADEPTGNLDSENSDIVFRLLSELARDYRISVLLVTHNPELAKMCDRVIEMKDGEIMKDSLIL